MYPLKMVIFHSYVSLPEGSFNAILWCNSWRKMRWFSKTDLVFQPLSARVYVYLPDGLFQVFFSAAPCLTEPSSWDHCSSWESPRPWSAITLEWLKPQSLNIVVYCSDPTPNVWINLNLKNHKIGQNSTKLNKTLETSWDLLRQSGCLNS